MHSNSTPQFSSPEGNFAQDLRTRVHSYFQSNNISKYGGSKILIKALLLISLFILNYCLLIFSEVDLWIKIILSISLGCLTSLIGFNIMHDGAHHSFSKKKWLNDVASYTLNFLGANVFFWKTKHNIVHHTYTNIPEVDDDINAGVFIYISPTKKKLYIHRFQHLYFPFVYAFLYLYWIFYADYQKYFLKKVVDVEISGFNKKQKIIFWTSKIVHLFFFVVLPFLVLGLKVWILLFLIYAFTTGLILSTVFQLAHIVEETEFPLPDNQNKMADEWMKHQLKTTTNFAMNSKVLSHLLGGLNYQIEHHLFPTISHIHYPAISAIVREVCHRYNISYYSYPTILVAVRSHYRNLKKLGRE
ncbi:MAG: acyl-CoA desaturase [Bacteroidia bacterium]|nr:acyl-CoA desaturase [Bacteroidia bacterium]